MGCCRLTAAQLLTPMATALLAAPTRLFIPSAYTRPAELDGRPYGEGASPPNRTAGVHEETLVSQTPKSSATTQKAAIENPADMATMSRSLIVTRRLPSVEPDQLVHD
jgi:hypothetical protein